MCSILQPGVAVLPESSGKKHQQRIEIDPYDFGVEDIKAPAEKEIIIAYEGGRGALEVIGTEARSSKLFSYSELKS